MDAIGANFLRPDRETYGRRALSVELIYYRDQAGNELTSGPFSAEWTRARVEQHQNAGRDVWLRVDYQIGQNLPPYDWTQTDAGRRADWNARYNFSHFIRRLVDPNNFGGTFAAVRGVICGNEPNMARENSLGNSISRDPDGQERFTPGRGIPPDWLAVVVYGSDGNVSDCVLQQVREVNRDVRVVLPGPAPWNADTRDEGDVPGFIVPSPMPRGRTRLSSWEQYAASSAWWANFNAFGDEHDRVYALHAYSSPEAFAFPDVEVRDRNGRKLTRALDESERHNEPSYRIQSWQDGFWGAQIGIRTYENQIELIAQQHGGRVPAHVVSEWNSMGLGGRFSADSYRYNLLFNAMSYFATRDGLLGVAVFLDDHTVFGPDGCDTAPTNFGNAMGMWRNGIDTADALAVEPHGAAQRHRLLKIMENDFDTALLWGFSSG